MRAMSRPPVTIQCPPFLGVHTSPTARLPATASRERENPAPRRASGTDRHPTRSRAEHEAGFLRCAQAWTHHLDAEPGIILPQSAISPVAPAVEIQDA